MKSKIEKKEDGTIVLTITLPKADVKKTQDEILAEQVQSANLPGFRKGKAPKKLVEQNVNPEKIREEILRKLLPKYYIEAITEHKLQPILNPKVHVGKVAEGEDWEYTATTCEAPEVDLKDYKKAVKDITAKSKIVLPGKEPQEPKLDEILGAILNVVSVTIPGILVEQEVDRLLSQMLDEIRALGLTLDQYLSSTKKTPQEMRAEYAGKAENDIKIEFILQKIAETEKIVVEEKEIEEAITKAKDEAERKNLEANRYVLGGILRQQKTLDFLKNL